MTTSGRGGDQPAVRKGPWTLEEDLILVGHISEHGEGSMLRQVECEERALVT